MTTQRAVCLFVLVSLAAAPGAQAQEKPANQPPLLFEQGRKRQVFPQPDGTIRITSGTGWLRFGQLLADFNAVVQFRTLKADTDAGLVFRTWASDGAWPLRGYRLALHDNRAKGRALVASRGLKLRNVTARDEPTWGAVGEWQTVTVSGAGAFVNVTVNSVPVGTFEVENRAGELLVEVAKGELELRSIRVDELPTGPTFVKPRDNARLPQPVQEVKPRYTQDAMNRKVQGAVLLHALVGDDGSVVGTSVVRSLDGGLDREAALAARQWRFKPAAIDGRPAAVIVTIELTFTLK